MDGPPLEGGFLLFIIFLPVVIFLCLSLVAIATLRLVLRWSPAPGVYANGLQLWFAIFVPWEEIGALSRYRAGVSKEPFVGIHLLHGPERSRALRRPFVHGQYSISTKFLGGSGVRRVEELSGTGVEGPEDTRLYPPFQQHSEQTILILVLLVILNFMVFIPWSPGTTDEGLEMATLEPFEYTGTFDDSIDAEGEQAADIHNPQIIFEGQPTDGRGIHFINYIGIQVRWTDEPDVPSGLSSYENQGDTFHVGVNEMVDQSFGEYAFATNEHGQEGLVTVEWFGGDLYYTSWPEDATDGRITTGDILWNASVLSFVYIDPAGDFKHPRRPLDQADLGNDYQLTITVGGYYLPISND